jgi:glycosyltransferase involved in cell wall biosynthesis
MYDATIVTGGFMIKMTVGLPLYNSKRTAWLALTSLCAQRNVSEPWELIVAEEETEDMVGEKTIRSYEKRLRDAGCINIVYISLSQWVPLSKKWLLMAQKAAKSSRLFLLQACDCYSQPYRLADTWTTFWEGQPGCMWIQAPTGFFYNVRSNKAALFDWDSYPVYHPCGLNVAIPTQMLLRIPMERATVRRGVDSWLYKQCHCPGILWMSDEHAHLGVDVHGLNKLSVSRGDRIDAAEPPFVETDWNPEGNLPKKIASWLREVGKTLPERYERFPLITIGVIFSRTDEVMQQRVMGSIHNLYYSNVEFLKVENYDRSKTIGYCRNQIVQQASGEYVAFIDDDDWVMPDYLHALAAIRERALRAGEDPVGVISHLTLIDETRYQHVQVASPGMWKRQYLLNHPFSETLKKHVTATMMQEAAKAKRHIACARWYYGYMYCQHNDNVSGNHWGDEKDGIQTKA